MAVLHRFYCIGIKKISCINIYQVPEEIMKTRLLALRPEIIDAIYQAGYINEVCRCHVTCIYSKSLHCHFLAHLSQRLKVSYCGQSSPVVGRPSIC